MNENGRERQTLAAPKGYVRPTHTYGLQRVGLAALINIRFLKYLPHPLAHRRPRPCLSVPPPASSRHRTPPPLAERSSKARYSICIFKLESLYTHSRARARAGHGDVCTYGCTRARLRIQRHGKASCHHHRHSPSPLPPPPASSSVTLVSSALFLPPPALLLRLLRPLLLTLPRGSFSSPPR